MIISKKHKMIFCRVARCGGNTITNAMIRSYGGKKFKASANLLQTKYKRFYKFCFIRNTYDRVASVWHENFYNYSLDEPKMKIHHDGSIICPVTFEFFVNILAISRKDQSYRDRYIIEVYDYNDNSWKMGKLVLWKVVSHANPYWMHPQIRYCNFIGRLENIQMDFNKVCSNNNAPITLLGHHNPDSKNSDYRIYYNENIKNRVYKLYKRDIDRYGFVF